MSGHWYGRLLKLGKRQKFQMFSMEILEFFEWNNFFPLIGNIPITNRVEYHHVILKSLTK